MAQRQSGRYLVVLVTCPTRRQAAGIARALVEERLAACVNVLEAPVDSVYLWKGKVERTREFLLLIKTSRKRLAALREQIIHLHSYEVPEVVALPIVAGSPRYLSWLRECLDPATKPR